MREHRDGDFTHILKYINLQTNEIRLRPMQYGTASEAANLLVDIYCEQGAPVVLQSLNCREFVQEIVGEIVKIWPNCKQLHGVVRLNSGISEHFGDQIILEQLMSMQKRLKTNVWAQLLRFLQWEFNSSFNNELGRSVFETVYGKPPSLGLPTSKLLEAVYDK
uniref:Uncharacterized protein n=1 Tax=Panagrolaimus sp. JU765 TaxID=591449 RepID=A0AC34Q4F2_9BILA